MWLQFSTAYSFHYFHYIYLAVVYGPTKNIGHAISGIKLKIYLYTFGIWCPEGTTNNDPGAEEIKKKNCPEKNGEALSSKKYSSILTTLAEGK